MRTSLLLLLTVLTACGGSGSSDDPGSEFTALLVVTNLDDSGPGSLRDAIDSAPDGAGIVFDSSLPTGQINLLSPLTPQGRLTIGGLAGDFGRMAIDGGGTTQLFDPAGGSVLELRDLVLLDGAASPGGALSMIEGEVILWRVQIVGCESFGGMGSGGAIHMRAGRLWMFDCAVTSCHSNSGGALSLSTADAYLARCSFYLNTSQSSGGAIRARASTIHMTDCAFHNNTAANDGGAVLGLDGGPGIPPMSIIACYCTFEGNTAGGSGGGIRLEELGGSASIEIHASIATGNTGGGSPDIQIAGAATAQGTWNRIGVGPVGSIVDGVDNNVHGAPMAALGTGLELVAFDFLGRAHRTPLAVSAATNVIPPGTTFNDLFGTITVDHQGRPRTAGAAGELGAVERP